jgi:glycosyltransferase involved in cell wall biosynthesis
VTTATTVTVVTTEGRGSMDRCGRELARRLGAPELRVDLERTGAGWFGVGPLAPGAVRGALGDRALLRALAGHPGVPHFLHHHLARYGPRTGRPYLVTAHDLIRHTDLTAPSPLISTPTHRDRRAVRADVEGVRRAAHVVAVSETTRRELIARLGLAPQRVTTVPHGLDHDLFRPVARRLTDAEYVLFVGSEHPRKNLGALLRAFALLRRDRPALRLVKVGAPGTSEARFGDAMRRAVRELGIAGAVDAVGEVPDDELVAWYSGAACLALPSRAEGFGLPPLEAMACGCPVVVSSAGALPEVVGGAGAVVAPDDVTGLAAALGALLDDPGLRRRRRDAGLRRAAAFDWERSAAAVRAVHERVSSPPVAAR